MTELLPFDAKRMKFEEKLRKKIREKTIDIQILERLSCDILVDLSRKENVKTPILVYQVATSYGDEKFSPKYTPMSVSLNGRPRVKISSWYEIPLKADYKKFRPLIAHQIAHEFKHYLQEINGEYYKYSLLSETDKNIIEGEANFYAGRYSGIWDDENYRLRADAIKIIKREFEVQIELEN